jgi:glucose-6-phosphate 1-dehydrogenase
LAEIYSEIFESRYELLRIKQIVPKQQQLDEINSFGDKAVNYYKSILKFAESEYQKPNAETTIEDFITIITIKLNLARIFSKYDFKDIKRKINYLATSLKMYEEAYQNLKQSQYTNSDSRLAEHLMMCEEMINLLPVKISKVNRGEEI